MYIYVSGEPNVSSQVAEITEEQLQLSLRSDLNTVSLEAPLGSGKNSFSLTDVLPAPLGSDPAEALAAADLRSLLRQVHNIYICVRVNPHIYIYIYMYVYVCVYVCTCTYVCLCVYIYQHVHASGVNPLDI